MYEGRRGRVDKGTTYMLATAWNMPRFAATKDRRCGSENATASKAVGPLRWAFHVSKPTSLEEANFFVNERDSLRDWGEATTHPARYSHETAYADVTIHGFTTGLNASPISLV